MSGDEAGNARPRRPARRVAERETSPNLIFWVALAAIGLGLARKGLQWMGLKRTLRELQADQPDLLAIERSPDFGRAAVIDLFRLMSEGHDAPTRRAASLALRRLWREDQLVVEEEKALAVRSARPLWRARRKYPRALDRPIPFRFSVALPDLKAEGEDEVPWQFSTRILGADRVSLEKFDGWRSGEAERTFEVQPEDRPGNGPFRLIAETHMRTVGLTTDWDLVLPQSAFSFEFDPLLKPEAIRAQRDDARAALLAKGIALEVVDSDTSWTGIDSGFVLRGRPILQAAAGLPCDVAGSVRLQFEGAEIPRDGGSAVLIRDAEASSILLDLPPLIGRIGMTATGPVRVRAVIAPDVHLAWCDPEIRSLWPDEITTDWVEVNVARL